MSIIMCAISTESALPRPMTYVNLAIHPIPSITKSQNEENRSQEASRDRETERKSSICVSHISYFIPVPYLNFQTSMHGDLKSIAFLLNLHNCNSALIKIRQYKMTNHLRFQHDYLAENVKGIAVVCS